MRNLGRILIFRYTLIVAAVLVALSLLVIIPIRSYAIAREEDDLKEQAKLLARDFRKLFANGASPRDIDAYMAELAGDLPVRLTVIDKEGVVLGDSDFPAEEMENHAGRPEVASALREGKVASARRESRTLGKGFIYAAAPILLDLEVVGVVRVALQEEDVTPVALRVWWIFLAAFGVLLAVIIAVSLWTRRTVTVNLKAMREAAAGLASGDLGRRVGEPDIEDFSELARDLNLMAEQLRGRIEESTAERGKLEAVLANISAGVMVADAESRIVLFNPAARRILGVEEEVAGRRIIEVFSSRELDVTVSRAALGESVDEEIELVYPKRMSLHIRSDPVRGSDGKIVATVSAIEDVTALERLNRMRQDFVANVSHELRTPVATIRALTDSLLDGALEDLQRAERFLRDLDREATRLSQLIEDLLTLSRLEAKEAALQVEEFSVAELLQECLEAKATLAEEYRVSLEMAHDETELEVAGDRKLLRSAVNNLIDNAVKYNRPGGRVVLSSRFDPTAGCTVIEVSDTGIGIPREELPRVFERFYRVDKARSRESGGTGLGLSIVRHIVELHGGTVYVSSEEGEGSAFTFTIPREIGR